MREPSNITATRESPVFRRGWPAVSKSRNGGASSTRNADESKRKPPMPYATPTIRPLARWPTSFRSMMRDESQRGTFAASNKTPAKTRPAASGTGRTSVDACRNGRADGRRAYSPTRPACRSNTSTNLGRPRPVPRAKHATTPMGVDTTAATAVSPATVTRWARSTF